MAKVPSTKPGVDERACRRYIDKLDWAAAAGGAPPNLDEDAIRLLLAITQNVCRGVVSAATNTAMKRSAQDKRTQSKQLRKSGMTITKVGLLLLHHNRRVGL